MPHAWRDYIPKSVTTLQAELIYQWDDSFAARIMIIQKIHALIRDYASRTTSKCSTNLQHSRGGIHRQVGNHVTGRLLDRFLPFFGGEAVSILFPGGRKNDSA